MSDGFIRHLIAFLGTMAGFLIFWAAYVSGANGWWWTFIGLIVIYMIIYKLVEA